MKLSEVNRPLWLRWQPVGFSPWLNVYVILTAIPWFGTMLVAVYRTRDQSSGIRHVELDRMIHQPHSGFFWTYAILTTLFLIWFTYFSGNKRVTESDKFAVFLMLCGASLGWIMMLIRYFSGA
jgi:hypothetical protein